MSSSNDTEAAEPFQSQTETAAAEKSAAKVEPAQAEEVHEEKAQVAEEVII